MAERVVITPHVIKGYSEECCVIPDEEWMKNVGAGKQAEIDLTGLKSDRLVLIVKTKDTASDLTLKAGNGFQAGEDTNFVLAEGSSTAIVPEPGRFKNMTGSDKGKMIMEAGENGSIFVGAIVLP